MKNHMLLLNTYLEKGEYGKAREYAGSLAKSHGMAQEYVRTGNMEVDSLLNYKLELICRRTGCIPRLSVKVPREPIMAEVDLNVILGNLLDNAAEADRKGRLLTRKARKEGHGIGLESVKLVLGKYGGKMKLSHENCIFKVDLMLFGKAAVGEEKELL